MARRKSMKTRESNYCLIKAIREAMGITTDEFAELAGLRYDTVYRAENGKVIRKDAIEKIANALNISEDIVSYSTGQFPAEKLDLMKKDPLFFKVVIDSICAEPEKLTKTQDYMESIKIKIKSVDYVETIKAKIKNVNNDVNKLLSKIKPS